MTKGKVDVFVLKENGFLSQNRKEGGERQNWADTQNFGKFTEMEFEKEHKPVLKFSKAESIFMS